MTYSKFRQATISYLDMANKNQNNISGGNVTNNNNNQASSSGTSNIAVDNQHAIDSNLHPLYLHNNDHPGLVLISKKLTGSDNFGPWKRSITIALSAKNKMGIVSGQYIAPARGSNLFPQWERVNDMIMSWLLNVMSEDISNSMSYIDSAASMWNELLDRFSTIDGHRIFQIQKDLHLLEQRDSSVEVYYHKMKGMWDEYLALETPIKCSCACNCGAGRQQEEQEQRRKLMQFLMGLHESFTNARGQILMMSPLPSVGQAYGMIKQEEKQ